MILFEVLVVSQNHHLLVAAGAPSEGILSLGGILRNSRRMLVLWDATYIDPRPGRVMSQSADLHRSG